MEQAKLSFREVANPQDAEAMRVIRNTCRSYMTRHTSEISREQQTEWWKNLDKNQFTCYLFDIQPGFPVGYGLLLQDNGKSWVTGGLLPAWRGVGLGRQLFQTLIDLSPTSVWLEVRADNPRAEHLYVSLGFVKVSSTETTITMRMLP